MNTKLWRTLEIFESPLTTEEIELKELQSILPEGVEAIIRSNWNRQLEEKQEQLSKLAIKSLIKPYKLDGIDIVLDALYQNDKPVMWPGPVITLVSVDKDSSKVRLLISQTTFPFIKGLQDPKVISLYNQQKIALPNPPLAICTFSHTLDNLLVLTLRGEKTNMYPGRLYGQGGNPLYVSTKISDHQIDEMNEEILIEPTEVDIDTFRFSGIVVDTDELPGKPDLVGWVSVNVNSDEIRKRIKARELDRRPNDAVDVVFVPASPEGLEKFLISSDIRSFCPPAHGGLVLYGYHNFGEIWAKEVLNKIS
jgi:hypothetical protein